MIQSKFNLIVRLKKCYQAFHKEVILANDPECIRFWKKVSFFDFIERVMQSSILYPRSIEECRTCVSDLAYGFVNNLGVGVFDISDDDFDRIITLVTYCAEEIIENMDSIGYYIPRNKFPKHLCGEDEYHYVSDLTSNVILTQLSEYTFRVLVKEGEYPDINEDLIQHSVFDTAIYYRS